jgi:predicted transposase YdaD
MSKKRNESQSFDKIIRENLEEVFLPLAGKLFGINIKATRKLPEKLLTTIEREPDFAKIVETVAGAVFILHLEFQTQDEVGMAFRMAEYKAILQRKFNLEVRQFVIFLGEGKSTMNTNLPETFVIKGFSLVDMGALSYRSLVRSKIPEEIILAILANFGEEKAEVVIRQIARRLQRFSQDSLSLQKYLRQLTILSRLRKLDDISTKIADNMPITYDIEKDYLFLKGIEKGIEQGLEKGIEQGLEKGIEQGLEKGIEQGLEKGIEQGLEKGIKQTKKATILEMLRSGELTIAQIARFNRVSEGYVMEVKAESENE